MNELAQAIALEALYQERRAFAASNIDRVLHLIQLCWELGLPPNLEAHGHAARIRANLERFIATVDT